MIDAKRVNEGARMRQVARSKWGGGAMVHLEDSWQGVRWRLRLRNILLVIVAVEAISFNALRWWSII